MLGWTAILGTLVSVAGVLGARQATPPAPEPATAVIRAETRLVLVDAVVTDKKGG